MAPRIITKDECEHALRCVEEQWDAPAGSPEGDWMSNLVDAIGVYEEKHYPYFGADAD